MHDTGTYTCIIIHDPMGSRTERGRVAVFVLQTKHKLSGMGEWLQLGKHASGAPINRCKRSVRDAGFMTCPDTSLECQHPSCKG